MWKPRLVSLYGAELSYFQEDGTTSSDSTTAASHAVSRASLSSRTQIDSEDLEDDPLGFAVHHLSQEQDGGEAPVWFLRASSLDEKKQWLRSLSITLSMVRWFDDYERVKVLGVVQ